MGTTAQKLNRVLETKSDLKTVINYSGANITNETTFKDYPKLLNKAYIDILNDEGESLYNALPKITGTGTNVNFDVEKGKMKIELNSSDLTQSGTPTPATPQDIHVITGSNNIKITDGTEEQNYPLSLGSLEYCKIGSNEDQLFKNTTESEFYDSTLELNEWYLKSNIDKTYLPATDTTDRVWTKSGVNKNNTYIYAFRDHYLKVGSKVYSNMFLEYNATYLTNNNIYGCAYNTTGDGYPSFRIGMTLSGPSTLANFRTWMNTNNPKFYYETVETKYTHISETDYPTLYQQLENIYNNAKSYEGVTHITQTNDDLPFNLEITALSKIE